eukprot:TRINITY_DN1639_c0_g1_i5.p1 TRINITY_DN1639_c0_g1~~TRINITY_DN1639_c0_g1_i5.p1  ORF type:complete len:236 (+),score=80.91 TRINITY_DN1639_c0_g1_i5:100-807(+)
MSSLSEFGVALCLTFISSLFTGLGGILVIINDNPSKKQLGLMEGFSAGVMILISFFDLLPESFNTNGFSGAGIWFFMGILFFAIIILLIPEPKTWATIFGLYTPTNNIVKSNDPYFNPVSTKNQLLFTGAVTAIGMCLHNFPEGIAVYLASLKGLRFGLPLALAIGLHNLPEGIAVALPIYYATKNKWKGVQIAFLSGLFEPLGVIFVGIFFSSYLQPWIVQGMLAAGNNVLFIY